MKPPSTSLIFCWALTVPSAFRNRIQTAPPFRFSPSVRIAPTAMSSIPSPSRSPTPATAVPNSLPGSSPVRPPSAMLIFCSSFTVPSEFRKSTQTVPVRGPPSSSLGAPAARSTTPSSSRSPMLATERPNMSSCPTPPPKPPSVMLIFWWALTVPSAFRKRIQTAPFMLPPSSARGAPTAMSVIPSPSRSPRGATARPNSSRSARVPVNPPSVSLIFWCDLTVPSLSRKSR